MFVYIIMVLNEISLTLCGVISQGRGTPISLLMISD